MDILEDFLSTYKKIKEYKNKKHFILTLITDMELIENKIINECKHNIILVYNKFEDTNTDSIRYATCLACQGPSIVLKYNKNTNEYTEYFSGKVINKNNIIDATEFVSEKFCTLEFCDEHNVVNETRIILEKILEDESYLNFKQIKDKIKESLINLYKEQNNGLKKVYKGND